MAKAKNTLLTPLKLKVVIDKKSGAAQVLNLHSSVIDVIDSRNGAETQTPVRSILEAWNGTWTQSSGTTESDELYLLWRWNEDEVEATMVDASKFEGFTPNLAGFSHFCTVQRDTDKPADLIIRARSTAAKGSAANFYASHYVVGGDVFGYYTQQGARRLVSRDVNPVTKPVASGDSPAASPVAALGLLAKRTQLGSVEQASKFAMVNPYATTLAELRESLKAARRVANNPNKAIQHQQNSLNSELEVLRSRRLAAVNALGAIENEIAIVESRIQNTTKKTIEDRIQSEVDRLEEMVATEKAMYDQAQKKIKKRKANMEDFIEAKV